MVTMVKMLSWTLSADFSIHQHSGLRLTWRQIQKSKPTLSLELDWASFEILGR